MKSDEPSRMALMVARLINCSIMAQFSMIRTPFEF